MEGDIRRRGLIQAAAGLVACIVAAAAAQLIKSWAKTKGLSLVGPGVLVLPALPGAWGLKGLLEAVSGRPFVELASSWDELKGWQRGVIGAMVAFSSVVVMVLVIVAFV
ncbi:MAG: hypothetical protein OXR73_13500 [Myxococcales bacterium]|nr:hypothetical protein [Myxococcales bacterium]